MKTYVEDAKGNRNYFIYFGGQEAAQEALDSLVGCENCTNCSRCSDCSDCSGCYGCFRCSRCSRCSHCSDCSDCYRKKEQLPEIPKIENIHQKIYEVASQPGCLDMDAWHSCETTHCRAGWAVHLAGGAGYALERKTSPVFAAMQIYKASGYEISPCRFFDTNEEALKDMKKLAEVELQQTGGKS